MHILYCGGVHYDALVPDAAALQAAIAAAKAAPTPSPQQRAPHPRALGLRGGNFGGTPPTSSKHSSSPFSPASRSPGHRGHRRRNSRGQRW